VKFYEFVDKEPAIGKLVVIEGTERVLAERALDLVLDRLLPADLRDLNLARFSADDVDSSGVAEALQAMPFLADRRVVVVSDTQTMRAAPRRDLWAVAQEVPDGSTLVLVDLIAPRGKGPQSFGVMAARAALRIDATAGEETRARFIAETLEELNAKAEPRVVNELARGGADLAAVRNDLEKLAIGTKTITLKDLERESLSIEDPKAYRYAQATAEGSVAEALAIANELLENDPRGGAVPLISALAHECAYIWELTRPGGRLPERLRFRERGLRPLAQRVGERRARLAYERAIGGMEAIVTGRLGSDPDDHKTLVTRLTVELARMSR
jgi:DNA polymerase III delta subunit